MNKCKIFSRIVQSSTCRLDHYDNDEQFTHSIVKYLILFTHIENALDFSNMNTLCETSMSGTHQDPILEHLLFNLIMNDLEDRVNNEVTKFGVDTK